MSTNTKHQQLENLLSRLKLIQTSLSNRSINHEAITTLTESVCNIREDLSTLAAQHGDDQVTQDLRSLCETTEQSIKAHETYAYI